MLFCVIAFSCVAYAAKGPCVWNGNTVSETDSYIYDNAGNVVGLTKTKVSTNNGYRCDNQNEEDCETGTDYGALQSIIRVRVFEVSDDSIFNGELILVSESESFINGLVVCGGGGC